MKKILFLILTLVISILLSLAVGLIIKADIFNIHEFGFQLLMFSIVGSVLYFTLKYLHIKNTITALVLLTLIFTFLYKNTTIMQVVGNLQILFFYLLLLFISLMIVLKFILFNDKFTVMRNLSFSIFSAVAYTAVHIVINIIIGTKISGSLFLSYFKNGFVIMVTLGVAFTVSEIVFAKLESIIGKNLMQEEEE